MKDANGNTLQPYQRVSCTDNHGNVRKGVIARLEFPKNPPRCSGDEGDVLVKCAKGEEVWTVPSDVVIRWTDMNGNEVTVGCTVKFEHDDGNEYIGPVKQIEVEEQPVLHGTIPVATVRIECDDGCSIRVNVDDVEVQ